MAKIEIQDTGSTEDLRRFMRHLLNDLRALETMLQEGMIEKDVRRIGAEQELFLVDEDDRPAPQVLRVLEAVNDPHYVTELAQYNIEFNSETQVFEGAALANMERELNHWYHKLIADTKPLGLVPVMTGILPTLRKSDLTLENMTPIPRYRQLNDAFNALRGEPYEFRITGMDELIISHDSVMLESCCTSFQLHFQAAHEEFAELYNIAQLVIAPVLAVGVNSPLLFGKRLWRETRIALFQQSIDSRSATPYMREFSPRVGFGTRWLDKSVTEIFKEDISRFRVLIAAEAEEDPFEKIRRGEAPSLKALRLHNGTVYRWNRACYGISDGKPHLRIEMRALPAGPTIADEVANAAFWYGLMSAVSNEVEDIRKLMDFDVAKWNFIHAARMGLSAQLTWLDGKAVPADRLILETLLPMAERGLKRKKIDPADIERYLGIIEKRVQSKQTGSEWFMRSLAGMKNQGSRSERLSALVHGTMTRQQEGKPVHEWTPATLSEAGGWQHNMVRVEQYMSTDLITVRETELVDLVACLMDWHGIRQVLVEDDQHRLVGLVSHRAITRLIAKGHSVEETKTMSVSSIMVRNPITIVPETTTIQAMELMREKRVSCLPVVNDGRLVGVVVEADFLPIARELLAEKLREAESD